MTWLIFLLILTCMLGLVRKSNKGITIVLLILILILFAGVTNGADYGNYKLNYENAREYSINGFEPLYQFMVLGAKKINLTFHEFFSLYVIFGMLLLLSAYKKYVKNINFVLILYFLYPFAMDTVQIRSFMSVVIVFIGLRFLQSESDKWNVPKYIAVVLLASMFHISALVYVIFILVKYLDNKFAVITTMSLSIIIYIFVNNYEHFIFLLPARIIRKLGYLDVGTEIRTKIILLLYFIISAIFFAIIGKKENQRINKEAIIDIRSICVKLNYVAILLYPIFICQISFLRLHRVIVLGNYILVANYDYTKSNKSLVRFAGFVYALVTFIAFIGLYNWESVVLPIFNSNRWFTW